MTTPAGEPVNVRDKLALIAKAYDPKIVAALDDHVVKVVKFRGPFVWHAHPEQDEMFLVVDGVLRMEFRDRTERVGPGEFIVVPKGVEHRPVAESDEVACVLIERADVLNTGDAPHNELTQHQLEWI